MFVLSPTEYILKYSIQKYNKYTFRLVLRVPTMSTTILLYLCGAASKQCFGLSTGAAIWWFDSFKYIIQTRTWICHISALQLLLFKIYNIKNIFYYMISQHLIIYLYIYIILGYANYFLSAMVTNTWVLSFLLQRRYIKGHMSRRVQ